MTFFFVESRNVRATFPNDKFNFIEIYAIIHYLQCISIIIIYQSEVLAFLFFV